MNNQKWYKNQHVARKNAIIGDFQSYFRVEHTRKTGKKEVSYFVGIFLPGQIKKKIRVGSVRVEEIYV